MSEQYYCQGDFSENWDGTETRLALRFGHLGIVLVMDARTKLDFIRALLGTADKQFADKRFINLPVMISSPPLVADKSGYTIIDEDKLGMVKWG
jgi:hypothetical protein